MTAANPGNNQSIIDRLDELPTLPSIVYELSNVINDPMSSTTDIEKIMANDQSLTTKVLRLANSAYYAIPGGVSSLNRAIGYIGFDTVNQLVLSASIIQALDVKGPKQFDLNQFWKHAVGVAMASETIAKFTGYKTPSDLFTCGLVHDMGKIAIYIIEPDVFMATVNHAKENKLSIYEAELAVGFPKHNEIGALLAEKWRLPSLIQAVVQHHHQRETNLRGGLSSELSVVVDIVYVANLLVHALRFGNSGHEKILGAPKNVVERMYLTTDKLKEVLEQIKEKLTNADAFLQIIGS